MIEITGNFFRNQKRYESEIFDLSPYYSKFTLKKRKIRYLSPNYQQLQLKFNQVNFFLNELKKNKYLENFYLLFF